MAERESLAAIYAQAREHGALLDLSDRAKWRLAGGDRVRYLNGQVTNDIRRLRPDAAMSACVTTAKGKLSGLVYVSAQADALVIDSDAELREALGVRLERYIIADDATLEDVTEEYCLLHVTGRGEAESTAAKPSVESGAEIRAATRLGTLGWDLLAPRASLPALLETLRKSYALVPPELAETLRIEAGTPRWGAELTEETLPPEAGLDLTAIDYHKGCYIGQEVISRIKSVGHVNRVLTGLAALSPETPLEAGMTLHPAGDPAQNAGRITSAEWSFGLETWAALGYLKRTFATETLQARTASGETIPIQTRALPLHLP